MKDTKEIELLCATGLMHIELTDCGSKHKLGVHRSKTDGIPVLRGKVDTQVPVPISEAIFNE